MSDQPLEQVDVAELVKLCALDDILFEKTFFSKTFRQASPPYSRELSDIVNSGARYINFQVFRGGIKTTKARGILAKRIAYGISRTILIIGKSENHALRTSRWLRLQVERNRLYREVFALRKGGKWQDHEFEILHGIDEASINVVAMGVTGSTRGVNIDDYRPDFILLDDIIDDENASTPEQRQKMDRLVYGALWESLAPASENSSACLLSLATPQNLEDYTYKARSDPQWITKTIACWTEETKGAPVHQQKSIWPERWPDEVLRAEKLAAMARNQLSIWMREKECTLITPEDAIFQPHWLKRWDFLPPYMVHYLVIDPVPPPSPQQLAKGLANKDYEALGVVGVWNSNFYIREILVNKGHDPTWTTWALFYLGRKYKVRKVLVDMTAYQRTLKWILTEAMRREHIYFLIDEVPENSRSKFHKIVDSLTEPGANGRLHIPPDSAPEGMANSEGMAQFISQFIAYKNVSHDDALEVAALGVGALTGIITTNDTEGVGIDDEDERLLYPPNERGIPGRTIAP